MIVVGGAKQVDPSPPSPSSNDRDADAENHFLGGENNEGAPGGGTEANESLVDRGGLGLSRSNILGRRNTWSESIRRFSIDRRSNSSGRRNSLADSVRRFTIDVGKTVGAIPIAQEDGGGDEKDSQEDSGGNEKDAQGRENKHSIATINNPVSFLHHTLSSNLQGLASAIPSCIAIALVKKGNEGLQGLGGFFGDLMVVRCVGCMLLVDAITIVGRWECSLTKAFVFVKIPAQISFMVAVSALFDWEIGAMTPLWVTVAFAFGEWCNYDAKTRAEMPFHKHIIRGAAIALALHGLIVFLIDSLILSTRVLSKGASPVMTVIVTGFLFPLIIVFVRKVFMSWLRKIIANNNNKTPEEKVEMLNIFMTCFSLDILLTPTTLLYFNASPKYALFSAVLQMITETAGKVYAVWYLKKKHRLFLGVKSTKGKVRVLASKTRVWSRDTLRNESSEVGETTEEDHDYVLDWKLRMLALRYHAEIIAEKGCITTAALIAFLFFSDLVPSTSKELVLIGVIFYVFECVTDIIFVWVMDKHFEVPMLSAVPHSDFFSELNLRMQAIMCQSFVAVSNCIAMASDVRL